MTTIAAWIRDRVAPERTLGRPQAVELAVAVGHERSLW